MKSVDNTGFGELKLVQRDDGFKYGIDAVLLADFADSLCHDSKSIADLGTGNGVVSIILSNLNDGCQITGIEFQEEALELACESLEINDLGSRIRFLHEDVINLKKNCPELEGKFDMVVTNPPYVQKGSGIENKNRSKFLARQETSGGLEDFIKAGTWLLKDRGHFFMVHRPSRLVDIICLCRKHGMEPKDLRFVVPRKGEKPNIVLIHCSVGGRTELNILPELAVYNSDGGYSEQIEKIYRRG